MEPGLGIVGATSAGVRGKVFPFIVLAIRFVIVFAVAFACSSYLFFSCDTRFLMLCPRRL